MEVPRIILFRAKRKDNGEWVEGYYCSKQSTTYCFKEDYERFPVETNHYIIQETMTDWGLPNEFRLIEIDSTTLSQFTGWRDSYGIRIYENNIVEFVSSPTRSEKYLMWWNREMSMITAVPLDGIEYNGTDYYNHVKYHTFTYDTFCLMMQDPWGDFREVKVVGNLFDNPELLEGEKENG